MKGITKIQLFEEGKVVSEVVKNNFFTKCLENRIANIYKQAYYDMVPLLYNAGGVTNIPSFKEMIKGVALLSDVQSNSVNDDEYLGILTGCVELFYGARPMCGSEGFGNLNSAESGNIEGGYRYVFDFPTDKANGTFRCVSLFGFLSENYYKDGIELGYDYSRIVDNFELKFLSKQKKLIKEFDPSYDYNWINSSVYRDEIGFGQNRIFVGTRNNYGVLEVIVYRYDGSLLGTFQSIGTLARNYYIKCLNNGNILRILGFYQSYNKNIVLMEINLDTGVVSESTLPNETDLSLFAKYYNRSRFGYEPPNIPFADEKTIKLSINNLASPVTKTSSQTMKITYDIMFDA